MCRHLLSCLSVLIVFHGMLAIQAAQRIPDEISEADLEQALRDSRSESSEIDAKAFSILCRAEMIPCLCKVARGTDTELARAAIECLFRRASNSHHGNADLSAMAALQQLASSPEVADENLAVVNAYLNHDSAAKKLVAFGAEVADTSYGAILCIDQNWTGQDQLPVLLRQLRGQVELSVTLPGSLSIDQLRALGGEANVRALRLSVEATDDGLAAIASLPKLKELRLFQSTNPKPEHVFTGSGLQNLAHCQELEAIDLFPTSIDEKYLQYLVSLPNLQRFSAPQLTFTDAGMEYVGQMPTLVSLALNNTFVSDEGLAHLRGLPSLQSLGLSGVAITDSAIPHLLALTSLQRLSLHETFVTSQGRKALLTNHKGIEISGSPTDRFSDEQLEVIRRISRLGGRATCAHVKADSDMPAVLQLTVHIGPQWRGEDSDWGDLAFLGHIHHLYINAPLDETTGSVLQQGPRIESIALVNTGLPDAGLAFLTKIPDLKSILLVGPFTDGAVTYLSQTTASQVNVTETLISNRGRQQLQAALMPNVRRDQAARDKREFEQLKQLVAPLCGGAAKTEANSRRSYTSTPDASPFDIMAMGARVVPALVQSIGEADPHKCLDAIRLLVAMGSRDGLCVAGMSESERREMYVAVQEALPRLCQDLQNRGLKPSDEEISLLKLGILGADLMAAPGILRSMEDYSVCCGLTWKGGDDGLKYLQPLKPLANVRLFSSEISSEGLAHLKDLKDLQSLDCWVNDFGLPATKALAQLATLDRLTIYDSLSAETAEPLSGMDHLRNLAVICIEDDALKCIGRMPKLESLGFGCSPTFSGNGLQFLASAPQLNSVCMRRGSGSFQCEQLKHLRGCVKLRRVAFNEFAGLDQSLACLKDVPSLEELSIHDTPILPAGIKAIGELKQLSSLNIFRSTILDEDLEQFAGLSELTQLDLQFNGVSDRGVRHLANLPKLQNISLSGTLVSSAEAAKYDAELARQTVRRDRFDRTRPDFDEYPPLSEETIAVVGELTKYGAQVSRCDAGKTVTLFACWSGGQQGLDLLPKLGDVRSVRLYIPVDDSLIPRLADLKQLREVYLARSDHTDEAVAQLKAALPNVIVARVGEP